MIYPAISYGDFPVRYVNLPEGISHFGVPKLELDVGRVLSTVYPQYPKSWLKKSDPKLVSQIRRSLQHRLFVN